jgi:hypothetical protein
MMVINHTTSGFQNFCRLGPQVSEESQLYSRELHQKRDAVDEVMAEKCFFSHQLFSLQLPLVTRTLIGAFKHFFNFPWMS